MPLAMRAPVLVAALALACLSFGPAWAGAPTDQLRTHVEGMIRVLENPDLKLEARAAERRDALRKFAVAILDFGEITRRSLGRHWQSATAAERAELVHAFAGLLERTYLAQIEQYSGEPIVWVGETIDGEHATVRTRLHTRQGNEIPVDYRMHLVNGRWRAYDVLIEGVSLIANYRAQFNKIVQTSSHGELIKRLRAKSEEIGAAGVRPPK